MENINAHQYLKELKKRAKKSRVYYKHQLTGLIIADLLNDKKHKSLYMKLAKEINNDKLLGIAKDIALNKRITNKGAYFMWELKNKNLIKSKKSRRKKSKKIKQIVN